MSVVPNGKTAGALFTTEAIEQLSDVIGVPKVTPEAVHVVVGFSVIFAGAVIAGF